MSNCARCGAQLGLGRYCINCGARASTDASPPPPPPPPPMPGTGSRYPLFADEVAAPAAVTTHPHRRDRRTGVPWLALLLAGALVATGLTGWLLLRGEDDREVGGADPVATPAAGSTATGSASPEPSATAAGPPRDLARQVKVQAPRPAPAGVDLSGNRVTYPVSHMFDRRSETAYRVNGDATGTVLTFTLPRPHTVTMVGLINGYAKTDGGTDWYPRQHRITRVAWVFDDGTRVEQDLKLTREMQQLAVAVETRTVELHILRTRAPGTISRARNATSISEVTLQGSGRRAP